MSKQGNIQSSTIQRPITSDPNEWKAYWKAHGQMWRTETEINKERKEYLEELRRITPDIKQNIYPFRGIKLSRADVEWLLETHDGGRGPVEWSDIYQHHRKGLDLRGADLQQIDLSNLPLARMCGGLTFEEFNTVTVEQFSIARVHLERAYLSGTHLEGAILYAVHLDQANLREAHLEGANLSWAHLERAILRGAHLEGADLRNLYFDTVTNLENVILTDEQHGSALVVNIHWGGVNLSVVDWIQIKMLGER